MPAEGEATTWSPPAHLPALPVLPSPGTDLLSASEVSFCIGFFFSLMRVFVVQ